MLSKALKKLPITSITLSKAQIRYNTTSTLTPSKPRMSAFRGGLLGFLLGSTIAGATGYYFLISDYQIASGLMLNSVKELQRSTDKVRDYAGSIEKVSGDLKRLKESSAQINQIENLREELRKLYNSVGIDMLEIKSRISELEKELQSRGRTN